MYMRAAARAARQRRRAEAARGTAGRQRRNVPNCMRPCLALRSLWQCSLACAGLCSSSRTAERIPRRALCRKKPAHDNANQPTGILISPKGGAGG